jgi:hypothetical protein
MNIDAKGPTLKKNAKKANMFKKWKVPGGNAEKSGSHPCNREGETRETRRR